MPLVHIAKVIFMSTLPGFDGTFSPPSSSHWRLIPGGGLVPSLVIVAMVMRLVFLLKFVASMAIPPRHNDKSFPRRRLVDTGMCLSGTMVYAVRSIPSNLLRCQIENLFLRHQVLGAYILNKIGRKSGRKYVFIRFAYIQEGLKAIEHLNGRIVSDCKLHVMWARFQKRMSTRRRSGSSSTRKKAIWKWITKVKNIPNQDFSSHYKQEYIAERSECQQIRRPKKEAVEEDVHEDLSDNNKKISQPLNNQHNRPIMLGSSPLKHQVMDLQWRMMKKLIAPYALSMILLKWSFNFMRKKKYVNFLARIRREAIRIKSELQICLTLLKLRKQFWMLENHLVFLLSVMRLRKLEE
ncbi:LOW QUALITY PROTEIN: hypothetical protein Cgig2_012497 [Carnegiea gigantea]|uniref:RRM domain-containing protein n=1 Tax=Carnegiea gigantea TaxID=171969 RepID=A0A9Q1K5N9_9CARY|nr:LOW QUALITY PROTEIN: hypothetical protein Cgig2_012497 [Carnegiea gigantea]